MFLTVRVLKSQATENNAGSFQPEKKFNGRLLGSSQMPMEESRFGFERIGKSKGDYMANNTKVMAHTVCLGHHPHC